MRYDGQLVADKGSFLVVEYFNFGDLHATAKLLKKCKRPKASGTL